VQWPPVMDNECLGFSCHGVMLLDVGVMLLILCVFVVLLTSCIVGIMLLMSWHVAAIVAARTRFPCVKCRQELVCMCLATSAAGHRRMWS